MCQNHKGILLDINVLVRKTLVKVVAVLVDHVVETNGDVSQSDDDVTANVRVFGRLEDLEEQEEIVLTEPRADAHELAQRKCSRIPERWILGIAHGQCTEQRLTNVIVPCNVSASHKCG